MIYLAFFSIMIFCGSNMQPNTLKYFHSLRFRLSGDTIPSYAVEMSVKCYLAYVFRFLTYFDFDTVEC